MSCVLLGARPVLLSLAPCSFGAGPASQEGSYLSLPLPDPLIPHSTWVLGSQGRGLSLMS